MKSLLNVILWKNLSPVAQIVSEIWLLQYRDLVPNGRLERAKIKFVVIFQDIFRDIGSPAPNVDTRIISFGNISPEMVLNEICFVFPGKIVFVDLF